MTLTSLPSTNNFTKDAVIVTTKGVENPSSNVLRILASTDGTVVKYQNATVATLNAGEFADIRTGAGGELTSNNPVLLGEYLTGESEHPGTVGDPALSFIPGTNQWLDEYVLSTPVGSQAYQTNFLGIGIKTTDLASLTLNSNAVSSSNCDVLLGTLYSACEIQITPGVYDLKSDNPFLALSYGGTSYDSYFTFLGTTFSAGASPPPPMSNVPLPASAPMFGIALLALSTAGYGLKSRRKRADV